MSSNIISIRSNLKGLLEDMAERYNISLSQLIHSILWHWLLENKDRPEVPDHIRDEIRTLEQQKAREKTRMALRRLNFWKNVENRILRILDTSDYLDNNIFIDTIKAWSLEAEALGFSQKQFFVFVKNILIKHYHLEEDKQWDSLEN